jgi:hypothetical protein
MMPVEEADEFDEEIFDDNDFYQQLLKDLIASGTGSTVHRDILFEIEMLIPSIDLVDYRFSGRVCVGSIAVGHGAPTPTQIQKAGRPSCQQGSQDSLHGAAETG